jgi:hypothetical protein
MCPRPIPRTRFFDLPARGRYNTSSFPWCREKSREGEKNGALKLIRTPPVPVREQQLFAEADRHSIEVECHRVGHEEFVTHDPADIDAQAFFETQRKGSVVAAELGLREGAER